MTDIDVPDWVVEVANDVLADHARDGDGVAHEAMKAALRAALSAWVVPLIRAAEEEVERRPLSTHTLRAALTALRQEKPE